MKEITHRKNASSRLGSFVNICLFHNGSVLVWISVVRLSVFTKDQLHEQLKNA